MQRAAEEAYNGSFGTDQLSASKKSAVRIMFIDHIQRCRDFKVSARPACLYQSLSSISQRYKSYFCSVPIHDRDCHICWYRNMGSGRRIDRDEWERMIPSHHSLRVSYRQLNRSHVWDLFYPSLLFCFWGEDSVIHALSKWCGERQENSIEDVGI